MENVGVLDCDVFRMYGIVCSCMLCKQYAQHISPTHRHNIAAAALYLQHAAAAARSVLLAHVLVIYASCHMP